MTTRVLTILIAIVVTILITILLAAPRLRIVAPDNLTFPVLITTTLVATLERKPWGLVGYSPIAGTVSFNTVPSWITTDPGAAASPNATFTVFGLVTGNGFVQVLGNSAYGSHTGWTLSGPWVSINVTASGD